MSVFPTKILLATDGSDSATAAARTAAELAEKTGSELHVVHVGELHPTFFALTEAEPARLEQEARNTLDEQVRRIEGEGGSVAEAHLRLGDAAERIVSLGEEIGAGVIVVGSRGLSGLRRAVMGSVLESVVRTRTALSWWCTRKANTPNRATSVLGAHLRTLARSGGGTSGWLVES